MRLTYDPVEDRVRLVLPHEGASVAIWLTRRQCIRMLASCLTKSDDDDGAPKKTLQEKAQTSSPSASAEPPSPPVLARLALREAGEALIVRFKLPDERVIGFRLNQKQKNTLANAFRNLERQARWNMFAAVEAATSEHASLRGKLH